MKYGAFSSALIPVVIGFIGCFSVVSIYYIAISLGHEEPLPHTWISKCAQHYPEYLIFRTATISGAVLMIMSYFINHFVILQRAYEKVFNVRKYHPEIILIFGIMGAVFLTGSTALIDTGKMNEHMHVFCAGNFFAWTLLANFYNGILGVILYRKANMGSLTTVVLKIVMLVALIIQVYLSQTKS
jgi:hypothetical protein